MAEIYSFEKIEFGNFLLITVLNKLASSVNAISKIEIEVGSFFKIPNREVVKKLFTESVWN